MTMTWTKTYASFLFIHGMMGVLMLNLSCGPKGNKPNVELIKDMMESPSIKSQEKDPFNHPKRAMGAPPPNTVPVGFRPYPYKGQPEVAGQKLQNPLKGHFPPSVLEEGKKYFRIYCQVCHGEKGAGDGTVSSKFPKGIIKSLLTPKVVRWPDGRIYHVISDGQGLMSSYAAQVPQQKRWALVQYIRVLQGQQKQNQNQKQKQNQNQKQKQNQNQKPGK